jgi:hypothetical protein
MRLGTRTPFGFSKALAFTVILSAFSNISCAQEVSRPGPKLILQITVDQLRDPIPSVATARI